MISEMSVRMIRSEYWIMFTEQEDCKLFWRRSRMHSQQSRLKSPTQLSHTKEEEVSRAI